MTYTSLWAACIAPQCPPTPPSGLRPRDLDALRLMVQGLAGRVIAVESEIASPRSQLAAVIADQG